MGALFIKQLCELRYFLEKSEKNFPTFLRVLTNLVGASTFTTTDVKLSALVVTLSTEDNAKLSKLLSKGLKDQFIGMNAE